MQKNKIKKIPNSPLRKINNTLSVVVVGLSLYVLVFPLLPVVTYSLDKVTNNKPPLVKANLPNQPNTITEEFPKYNTVVIPSINLQKTVFEGKTVNTLNNGVWHRPLTGNPNEGSNMVLAGHRYGYNGDGVFYHLDKVNMADSIILYWRGTKFKYTVKEIKVVPATDISVEAQSDDSLLTIYTCTPMWSFKDRLVIVARRAD